MKPISTIVIALMAICAPGVALAKGKHDPENVCPRPSYTPECDLLVETAVTKDVSVVIQRNGSVLKIHAKNGNTVERKNSGPEIGEAGSWKLWVCDYFPEHGYVRLCYRLWESSKTEFININSGQAISVDGWPIYSPSRRSVLMVDGYAGEIYGLEIWRFGEKELLNEFRLASPPGQGWEVPTWKSEKEIASTPESSTSGQRYKLVKEAAGWVLRGQ